MSLSPEQQQHQYQQYYLQSMGVDVYLMREQTSFNHHSQQLKPSSSELQQIKKAGPETPTESEFVLTKATLIQSVLIKDVCQLLSCELNDIEQCGTNQFNFGGLLWHFESHQELPRVHDGQLISGSLDKLQQKANKRQLWRCLCEIMDSLNP